MIHFTLNGENITTRSGIYAEVFQPHIGQLVKSQKFRDSWQETIALKFQLKEPNLPFYFRLRRDKTADLDNLLSGKINLSRFSIEFDGEKLAN